MPTKEERGHLFASEGTRYIILPSKEERGNRRYNSTAKNFFDEHPQRDNIPNKQYLKNTKKEKVTKCFSETIEYERMELQGTILYSGRFINY